VALPPSAFFAVDLALDLAGVLALAVDLVPEEDLAEDLLESLLGISFVRVENALSGLESRGNFSGIWRNDRNWSEYAQRIQKGAILKRRNLGRQVKIGLPVVS
jgi:hypothetical protein